MNMTANSKRRSPPHWRSKICTLRTPCAASTVPCYAGFRSL